jgi:methanogenic corrinoid protein MtbC1
MKVELVAAMVEMNEAEALRLARAMLDAGEDPQSVLNACGEALADIGRRYEAQEYFLPELIIAGEMMKAISDVVKPRLRAAAATAKPLGKILLGTVAGDIHDLGKDVVAFMLDANHFEVHNIGVDVPPATFVAQIHEVQPDIVGLSGFLTLAFEQMRATIDAIKAAGLRDRVKIMIGGAIMNDEAAQFVGADAYGKDATVAVRLAKAWTGAK